MTGASGGAAAASSTPDTSAQASSAPPNVEPDLTPRNHDRTAPSYASSRPCAIPASAAGLLTRHQDINTRHGDEPRQHEDRGHARGRWRRLRVAPSRRAGGSRTAPALLAPQPAREPAPARGWLLRHG